MEIKFFKMLSDKREVNKTLVDGVEMEIFLKKDTDILRPKLILKSDYSLNLYNYCFISGLEKYYFVERVETLSNELLKLDLVCDVLQTHKDKILGVNCLMSRGVKDGDYYNGIVEINSNAVISKFMSDVTLIDSQSLILSTVGV